MQLVDFIDLRAGYIDRAMKDFPKQGSRRPLSFIRITYWIFLVFAMVL